MPTEFQTRVYQLTSRVPRGKVTTYGAIAKALGKKGHASRAVGQALNRNPFAPTVPCHRVVQSDGKLGGFGGELATKIERLEKEGIKIADGRVLHFPRVLYTFNRA